HVPWFNNITAATSSNSLTLFVVLNFSIFSVISSNRSLLISRPPIRHELYLHILQSGHLLQQLSSTLLDSVCFVVTLSLTPLYTCFCHLIVSDLTLPSLVLV